MTSEEIILKQTEIKFQDYFNLKTFMMEKIPNQH